MWWRQGKCDEQSKFLTIKIYRKPKQFDQKAVNPKIQSKYCDLK